MLLYRICEAQYSDTGTCRLYADTVALITTAGFPSNATERARAALSHSRGALAGWLGSTGCAAPPDERVVALALNGRADHPC